jgi:hypothetical protein
MPKTSSTEWLLARLTDRTRAAAIMGDLTELAATRGRLWFWTAYTRTLIALGWRTPAAIVAAIAFSEYVRGHIAGFLGPRMFRINDPRLLAWRHSNLSHFSWTVSLSALNVLWIVFPYVAIRFGLRNRLTYLAGTLFMIAIPVYTFRSSVYEFTGLFCALIMVAALASPLWRWQMIFLAANYPVWLLVFYACITDPSGIFHPHHHLYPMSLMRMRIDGPLAIGITALLGPYLYRLLLRRGGTKVAHA